MTTRRYIGTPAVSPSVESRGGRGGLPSGSSSEEEEEKVSLSSLPESRADAGTLADALLTAGVLLLAPPKRLQVAEQLAAAGVTVDDLELLRAYIGSNEPDEALARRYLCSIVMDPKRTREALDGLREFQRRRTAAASSRSATHYPGFPSPYHTCACECCTALRGQGVADKF